LSCPQQIVYGLVDGSMLLTEQGWQETKVGRVFEAQLTQLVEGLDGQGLDGQGLEEQGQPNWQMSPSEYVALSGNHEAFSQKFEQLYEVV
jgi:hypothetical protein